VLLTRRARSPWKGCWETPGGYVEWGEHPEAAVRRELSEELGAVVETAVLLGVYVDAWQPGEWHQTTVYEVSLSTPDESLRVDPDEVSDWRWFSPLALPQEMASTHAQRIHDWLSQARPPPSPARTHSPPAGRARDR
jgi:8-oxo-dGTP diphosphatase